MKKPVKLSLLDKAVGYFSPGTLNKRVAAKMKMQAAEQIGYVTPGSARKTMKGVVASANSPDRDMAPKLKGSRALARDMYMNSPLATGALKQSRTNIVGAGLTPQPVIDREYLGLSEEEAKEWESTALREFTTWADSTNSDFTRQLNFWDNQGLGLLSSFMNGDCFMMLPWKKPGNSGNWPYELRVKLIESDLIRNPHEEWNGYSESVLNRKVISGIKLSKQKVIQSAFFADHYPWEYGQGNFKGSFKEVPLFDRNGRQNWYQIFEPERINQRRGMSYLAPVLDLLKTMTRLTDAQLMQALVASLFTVFVKDMSGAGGTLNEPYTPSEVVGGGGTAQGADGEQVPQQKDSNSYLDLELGSGLIHYLDDDKEIQIADSKHPNDTFGPFFEALANQLGSALEIPAELLLLKFTASYSASRGAILQALKFWKRKRTWFVRSMCQPVYEEFITECVIKGRLTAPGFFDDPVIKAAWVKCMWAGPGQGQLDPLKEAKASVLKIGANLSTHQEEYVSDKGGHWGTAVEQKAREKNKLDSLGLESNLKPKELTGPDGREDAEERGTEEDA